MSKMLLFVLVLTLLWSSSQANGQQPTAAPQARLLSAIGNEGGDLLNMLYKVGLEVQAKFDPKEDTFAIRVCSNDPLPLALPTAAGAPFLTTIKLEKLGIPKSRIYYLRQNTKCAIPANGYALTEYWLVPKGAELPEHVEARSAANLLGQQFTHWGGVETGDRLEVGETELLTPQSYAAILEKIVALLKENKNAIAVIQVRYYKRSSPELDKTLADTQNYLRNNGISPYRVHTKRIYWGPSPSAPEKYPNLFVVMEN
jgi:hypothetical protein